MVVPVGSLGDILAIIDAVNSVYKAFSAKVGSKARYRELKRQIDQEVTLFSLTQARFKDIADDIGYVPQFRDAVESMLLLYGMILADICGEVDLFARFGAGSSLRGDAGAGEAGGSTSVGDPRRPQAGGSSTSGSRSVARISSAIKDGVRVLDWAFVKEKNVKEKMESLRKQRENITWLLHLAQL